MSAEDWTPPVFEELTRHDDELRYRVEMIVDDFDRAAAGDSVAFHGSDALSRLERLKDFKISTAQRDRLLRALLNAGSRIIRLFQSPEQLAQAVEGIEAASTMIIISAEPAGAREALSSHIRFGLQACARILRNNLHNLSLAEEMAEREAESRAKLYGLFGLHVEG